MESQESDLLKFTSYVKDYLEIIKKYQKKRLETESKRNSLINQRNEVLKEIDALQIKIAKMEKKLKNIDNQISTNYINLERDELTEIENLDIESQNSKYIFPLSYYIEEVLKELNLKREDIRIKVRIDNTSINGNSIQNLNEYVKYCEEVGNDFIDHITPVVSIYVGSGKNRNRIALAWDTCLTSEEKDGSLLIDNLSLVSKPNNHNTVTYLEYTGDIDNLMIECTLFDLFSYRMIRNKNNHELIKNSLFKAIERYLGEELIDSSSKKHVKQ